MAATASFAQSTVTLYGVANIGVNNSTKGGKANLAGGADGTDSRIGFRGTEDLGNGLSAGFTFEMGFKPDTGNLDNAGGFTGTKTKDTDAFGTYTPAGSNTASQIFQRQAFASVASKSFGEVRLGRQYTLGFDGTIGSMPSTYIDSALGVGLGFGGMGARNSDQMQYRSPSFAGFAVHLSTQLAGDIPQTPSTAAKNTEARLAYSNGPLAVNLTTATVKPNTGASVSPLSVNAAYDLGTFKLYAGYINTDRTGNLSTTQTVTGKGFVTKAYIPVGAHSLHIGYAKNNTNKADAYELGDYYSLSKRTKLYAIYANGSNDLSNGAAIDPAMINGKRWALGVHHAF